MPSDLGGPEKPLPKIDWGPLLAAEQSLPTPAREMYSPKRVRPRHRIAVMLHEAGWKTQDIANALGYTVSRVSVILNSRHEGLQTLREGFASKVADNVLDTQSRLKLYANEMLTILVGHARNNLAKPELSRLAARDILHMAGFTPVKKVFQANANVPFDKLQEIAGRIQESNEVVLNPEWEIKDPAA